MKNKKILIIILTVLVIGGVGIKIYIDNKVNSNIVEEYIPEEEISKEQLRQTIITLYYKNIETGEIATEARRIDAALLVKSPFEYLINCLIEGPKNEKLDIAIPKGTKLNKMELKGEVLNIDFSKEFIENEVNGKEDEMKIIKSIFNTVTQLKEVNEVKILINGEEGKGFKDNAVTFKDSFTAEKINV